MEKCINCIKKVRKYKLKEIRVDHSAYDRNCPCYAKELEKQKDRIKDSI